MQYSFQVSYNFRNGEAETAHVFPKYAHTKEENTDKHFCKIFSAETEKEAEKLANNFAKEHNRTVRERRAKIKAEEKAKKDAKKALREEIKNAVETRIQSFVTPEIKKIVAILFEKQKANLLDSLTKQYNHLMGLLKEIEGVSPQVKKYKDLMDVNYRFGRGLIHMISDRVMEHKKDAKSEYEGTWKIDYPLFFKKDAAKYLDKMIQEDLNSIMDSFLAKMESKLGEVIKGKKIKEFVSNGLHDGSVHFTFSDGSIFLLTNSIEWGTSKYNVVFQRFPCRFHEVKFVDGKTEKWVSEEQMKKDF